MELFIIICLYFRTLSTIRLFISESPDKVEDEKRFIGKIQYRKGGHPSTRQSFVTFVFVNENL